MNTNIIYNYDFLRNDLPDHCADVIIADPPYFKVKGAFDKVWPTFDAYLEDVDRWARECSRILSYSGTMIWYGSHKRIAYTQVILDRYFHLLNNCTIRKLNSIQAVLANPDKQRSFLSNDERFLVYENSSAEKGQGGAALAKNEYTWRCGMLKTECFRPLVDYLISERDRAGFTTEQVNRELHTQMAGHWFTRKSQWELPTAANYERLRNLFNRTGGDYLRRQYEDLRRQYEDLRRQYEDLRRQYEDLRRPFQMEGRQTDVFDVVWDSGASSRFGHETTKDLRFTELLVRCISRIHGGGMCSPIRRIRYRVPRGRPLRAPLYRLRDQSALRRYRKEEARDYRYENLLIHSAARLNQSPPSSAEWRGF